MHHHALREIAKVAIGLFIADIICGIWLGTAGLLPITVLGISWGPSYLVPGIVIDIVIILLLAHYAWRMSLPVRSPSERMLLHIVGFVFLIVALVHAARLVFGWNVTIGDLAIPLWLSWCGVALAGYLSYSCFHFVLRGR
jgi:hypothetical protein